MVDLLDDAVAGVPGATAGDPAEALTFSEDHPGCAVFRQTEGGLSPEYGRWATELLRTGATILEINTFALASPWRPRHERYRMVVLSNDGLHRYRLRSAATPGAPVRHAAVLGYPLLKELGDGRESRLRHRLSDDPEVTVLSRVGRPDIRKWTDFEVKAAVALARSRPARQFVLLLVGAPPELDLRPSVPNLTVRCLDYVDVVGEVYAASDIYLHRSRIGETYGMTLYEAAAQGCLVIAAMDLDWDTAPLEFLSSGHQIGTPRQVLRVIQREHVSLERPTGALVPKTLPEWLAQLGEVAEGRRMVPLPTLAGAVGHLRRTQLSLGAGLLEVPRAVVVEVARAVRRWLGSAVNRTRRR